MKQRRILGRLKAGLVLGFLMTGGSAQALPCSDPITYMYICCPKPCQINDGNGVVQNTFKTMMEASKLTSMIGQMTAWKEQLNMFGSTLNMINSLIAQLFGNRHAAISGFGNPVLVPYGMRGNPLDIGQMAGQTASIFFRPGATSADEMRNAQARRNMVSSGYVESMASGVNGRTVLDKSAEEYRDLLKVVNNSSNTDTGGARDENDVNVHTDLAAMNQGRLAMLRAAQNQLSVVNVTTSTEAYQALGKFGVDNTSNRKSWGNNLSTTDIENLKPTLKKLSDNASNVDAQATLVAAIGGHFWRNLTGSPPQSDELLHLAQTTTPAANTDVAPKSGYGAATKDFQIAARKGFINPEMTAEAESNNALLNYDNLMERAVQIHNAATAYVSMRKTMNLNQETIALYDITVAAAAQQRLRILEGLEIMYRKPEAVFRRMAIETIGRDGMGGIDPYKYGDSVTQQNAARAALNNLAFNAEWTPRVYGGMRCVNVYRNNRYVAFFMGITNASGDNAVWTRKDLGGLGAFSNGYTTHWGQVGVAEPGTTGPGGYLAGWTRKPTPQEIADEVVPEPPPPPKPLTPTQIALMSNPYEETCGQILKRWLLEPAPPIYDMSSDTTGMGIREDDIDGSEATKKAIREAALKEFITGNDAMQMEANYLYWINLTKRSLWMKEFADYAREVIRNTQGMIQNIETNSNDPTTTIVLKDLPGIGPININNGDSVNKQIKKLLDTAAIWRGRVDPKTLEINAVSIRDAQLRSAATVIKADTGFTKWANTAPADPDVPCSTQQCWGIDDPAWKAQVTVMGQNRGSKNPWPNLPVVTQVRGWGQPPLDASMGFCDTISVNTENRSFIGCPVTGQIWFEPSQLVSPPFATGATIQR